MFVRGAVGLVDRSHRVRPPWLGPACLLRDPWECLPVWAEEFQVRRASCTEETHGRIDPHADIKQHRRHPPPLAEPKYLPRGDVGLVGKHQRTDRQVCVCVLSLFISTNIQSKTLVKSAEPLPIHHSCYSSSWMFFDARPRVHGNRRAPPDGTGPGLQQSGSRRAY